MRTAATMQNGGCAIGKASEDGGAVIGGAVLRDPFGLAGVLVDTAQVVPEIAVRAIARFVGCERFEGDNRVAEEDRLVLFVEGFAGRAELAPPLLMALEIPAAHLA